MNLQESIRKILREESRLKKTVDNSINQYGLRHTAKIMGISMTKIVEISEYPIDSETANDLLIENLKNKKLPREYRNFKIYPSFEEIVYWDTTINSKHFLPNMTENISVVATPFWDGNPWTPIDIDSFALFDKNDNIVDEKNSDNEYYIRLNHQSYFDYVDELFEWYKEYYLPEVYSTIMNDLLPEVYQDIKMVN